MGFFRNDSIQIIVFQSYGTSNHLYVRGRALEDENIDLSKKGFYNLLKNTWRRFETDAIPNTKLTLKLPDNSVIYTQTDTKGYFLIDTIFEGLGTLTNEEGWLQFTVSFAEIPSEKIIKQNNIFPGEMLIPELNSSFGLISDIDDTILQTGLTSRLKWQVIKNTVFKRAEKRIPLEGAADFYHQLHRGDSGKKSNPVFYVSHSPWNLYLYLQVFLKTSNFPKGPILLRNFVNPFSKKTKAEKPQKQHEILNIMKAYPELPFILIGDSGEHDPDIYIEIAEAHPERILAIYMRSVNHKQKMLRVKGLFQDYETVPVLLVENSKAAIEHARDKGFIQ